jgi:hypothetical protein
MSRQINNFKNSTISGAGVDNTDAQIDVQTNQFTIEFKLSKIDRYDIYNLSKKNKDIPKKNEIEFFDIKKVRDDLYTLSHMHAAIVIILLTIIALPIVLSIFTSISINPTIVVSFVILSFVSYFTLLIKSDNKKYTKATTIIDLNNLIQMKNINSKITTRRFIPGLLYIVNHIFEPYYNYYAFVVLVNSKNENTYLYFKNKDMYKNFKSIVERYYLLNFIED